MAVSGSAAASWFQRFEEMWRLLQETRHALSSAVAAALPDDFTRFLPEYDFVTFSLDRVPDAFAWCVVVFLAVYLVRLVLVHRPRLSACGGFVWLSWLSWDVAFVHGQGALVMAKARGAEALIVTARFTRVLVELVRAWTHFFMPFMNDVCSWASRLWSLMSLRQRLGVLCAVGASYGVVVTLRMFWKHHRLLKKTVFHASFLIFGPSIWHLCGVIGQDWYSMVVAHSVTTLPTVLSLLVLGWESSIAESNSTPSQDESPIKRSIKGVLPTTNHKLLRLFLSYWTCWPALAVLELLISRVPVLVGSAGSTYAAHLQRELQRAMITFVIWLMLWQGSRLLNVFLRACLFNTGIWENIAWFFGARGLEAVMATKGGLYGALMSFSPLKMTRLLSKMSGRLWVIGVCLFFAVCVLCLLIWVFYSAVSVVSQCLTLLLWGFAALDSADALTQHAEGFYYRKLAFWVLAMLWELLVKLPYVGSVLSIFTPLAFALFFVAGEFVLRRLLLPVLQRSWTPLRLLVRQATKAARPQKPGSGSQTSLATRFDEVGSEVGEPAVSSSRFVARPATSGPSPMMMRLLSASSAAPPRTDNAGELSGSTLRGSDASDEAPAIDATVAETAGAGDESAKSDRMPPAPVPAGDATPDSLANTMEKVSVATGNKAKLPDEAFEEMVPLDVFPPSPEKSGTKAKKRR